MTIGFLFPKAAPPPPPPPNAPGLASPSIAEAAAAERQRLASEAGAGSDSTNVTGGQGVKPPDTTAAIKPLKTTVGG